MSFTMRRPIPTDYDDYDSDHEMEPSEAPESEMLVDGAESVAGQSQAQSSLHPDDSLSQRGSRPLRYSRRYVEDMDTSDNQSVISFHSSGRQFVMTKNVALISLSFSRRISSKAILAKRRLMPDDSSVQKLPRPSIQRLGHVPSPRWYALPVERRHESTCSPPIDDTEHERLDMQHTVLKLLHDGLYISKPDVERALQRDQRLTPTVIDIGTGSGRW